MDEDAFIPVNVFNSQEWAETLHKIKSPLTVLKSRLEQALELEPNTAPELIKGLHTEVNKLVTTVNNLGIGTNPVKALPLSKINLKQLAIILLQRFQLAYPELSINHHLQGELFLYDNEERLSELLSNLLENACKYTPQGQVLLEILRQNDQILICIRDSGIGIAPEDIPKIFDTFFRASNARETGTGYGIGLYIVQQIIETLQGEIKVESTLGKGSTFLVKLPV